MDYAQALKKVQTKRVKDNYLVIQFSYDAKLILPHKDGLLMMTALANAEQLNDPYNEPHRIKELDRSRITVTQMSQEEYEQYKIAALLNLSVGEVRDHQLTITQ
jgi:hypothetical protein